MSKRRRSSQSKAAIEAALQISLEHARLIENILARNTDGTVERVVTDLELTELPMRTAVKQ